MSQPEMKELLAKVLLIDADHCRPEVALYEDLGIDSLARVRVAHDLSNEVPFQVSARELEDSRTIGDLMRILEDAQKAG